MLVGPYHPPLVHFPIAFYCLALGMLAAYAWRRLPEYERFAYWLLVLSLLTALLAGLSGVVDRGQLPIDDPRLPAIDRHVTASVAFMVLNGLAVYMRFRWPEVIQTTRRWPYFGLLLAGFIALLISGHLGGDLVYSLQIGIRDGR